MTDTETLVDAYLLPKVRLRDLVDLLWARGFRVVGPVVRDHAVLFGEVRAVEDLPLGWRDEQRPGRYELRADDGRHVFGVVNGPGAPKAVFYVPRETLAEIRRERAGFAVREVVEETQTCRRAWGAPLGCRCRTDSGSGISRRRLW